MKKIYLVFLIIISLISVKCHYNLNLNDYQTFLPLDEITSVTNFNKINEIDSANVLLNNNKLKEDSGALIRCFWLEQSSFSVYDLKGLESSKKYPKYIFNLDNTK